MTFMHASENRTFRLVVVFLMIFALALTVARPARAIAVTSILIPAVIATLGAWGIGTAADGLDGDEIAEWFHEKLTSWETAAEISLANIATGIKMTPLGQVLLNPFALAGIREFGAWLVQQEGLTAGGSSVPVIVPSSGAVTALTSGVVTSFGAYTNGSSWAMSVNDSGISMFLFHSGTAYFVCFCSDQAHSFVASYYRNGSAYRNVNVTLAPQSAGCYGSQVPDPNFGSSFVGSIPVYSSPALGYESFVGGSGSDLGSMDLVPSSSMSVPTAADVQDKELLLNTSLDVGADAAAWYDSVMQKVAANDLTVTGTITHAGTITADQVLDQGAIREEDGAVVWPDVVQPIGVTGLDDIFPFCIPFDIYHFCQALAAEPVAPSFDVPFVIPGIVDYTFHLDLEDFDQVAALLRTLELLLFCVGLAFVTRSMFIRG